ncbi:MAG: ATP-binding protein [Halobacteriaceae archaeon]
MVSLLLIRVVMATAGIALLGTAIWIYRTRDTPALRPFALFVGTLGTLAVADALAAGDLQSLTLVWLTTFLAIPLGFAWFVVEYYGLPHLASPTRKASFLLPAVSALAGGAVLVVTPEVGGSMTGGGPTTPGLPSMLGVAGLAEQIGLYYAGGVMIAGVGLLIRTVSEYEYLDRRLGVALSFAAVWPWIAYFLTPAIVSQVSLEVIMGLNATGYTLSVAAIAFAVTRGGIFDAAPAAGTLGAETVLADLETPVVVVDHDHRVVKLNRAATDTFGLDRNGSAAETLSACVGVDLDTLRSQETVELRVPEGTRRFEASVSQVSDRFGRQPGHAIVVTDITQERVRSQRLSVLTRVLRHNLRNGMTTIKGRAKLIADDDPEDSDSVESILSSADELMAKSERVRQVEQMLATSPETERAIGLADVADRVIEDYRAAHPEASFSVDIDASLRLRVDEQVLSIVLDNLVENAVIHNDAPTPVVTVSARMIEGTVQLSVADNGPGIPEYEIDVVEGGDEDALEHGSGLGLWVVKWGVVRLGGDLTFSKNEPRGTAVMIDIPGRGDAETTVLPPTSAETEVEGD